jgi:hypothetical protein
MLSFSIVVDKIEEIPQEIEKNSNHMKKTYERQY